MPWVIKISPIHPAPWVCEKLNPESHFEGSMLGAHSLKSTVSGGCTIRWDKGAIYKGMERFKGNKE